MKLTVSVILDKRRAKAEQKYPVKLRITYQRKQKYYPLGIDVTEDEYESILRKKPRKGLHESMIKLMEFEAKANKVVSQLPDFSFSLFERKYFGKTKSPDNIYPFFEDKIEALSDSGRAGTACSYRCAMISMKKFAPKVGFKDVDIHFLREYEEYMVRSGNCLTTVGIYLRSLRSIFNDAIDQEIISREYYYPFGKRRYVIPASRNVKKALSLREIKKIFEYAPEPSSMEAMAVDLWKFSYLCNGMNMTDIANLKYGDIDGEFIKFRREKTKGTTRGDAKMVAAYMADPVKEIIRKWGNKERHEGNFIFPIIHLDDSPERKRALIQQSIKQVNKYMKKVALELKIEKPCSSGSARHSFSTVLKRSGASVEFISESLGHSSVLTTASYLDSFEDERKKEFSKALTKF
ncbi:MAG: phage integrase SAM-like domain-containing protein [Chitinophagales bacterium]